MNCGIDLNNGAECNCEIVYNHVLAYCQAFLHNTDVNTVAKAAGSYFSEYDLMEARKLLKTKFTPQLAGLEISKTESRRSTPQRSSSAMIAQDITDAVYKLMDTNMNIQFVTLDLKKLPILQPFSVVERSVAEKVLSLEKKLQKMEEMNEEMINEQNSRISRVERGLQCTNERNGKHKLHENEFPSLPNKTTDVPHIGLATPWNTPLSLNGGANGQHSRSKQGPQRVESTQNESSDNTGEWQIPREHRKRENRSNIKTTSDGIQHPRRIQGTATGTGVKAGPGPSHDLWVCNVDKDTDDEDMKKFIEEGGSNKSGKVTVRLWEPRYKPEWDNKRFRLTIPLCDYNRVFNAEFWPENVWIKKYWVDLNKGKNCQKATDDPYKDKDKPKAAEEVPGAEGGS